jgi:hypothetical protein
MLIDAQSARLRARLADALGPRAATRAILNRRGPEVLAAYVNADLAALDAEFQSFITRITAVGAKQRVTAGESPLD